MPVKLNIMHSELLFFCWRCKTQKGPFLHILWSCEHWLNSGKEYFLLSQHVLRFSLLPVFVCLEMLIVETVRQSLAAGLLIPGPGGLPHCWLSLWPWPNTPETNNECFTNIQKLSGVCWCGVLQGPRPLWTGRGDPAILFASKKSSTVLLGQ